MAAEFIGSTVLVTLHSPPNAQVRGVVLDISNQMLFLSDVYWLASGHRTPTFHVPSTNLADLEVTADEKRDLLPDFDGTRETLHRASISPPQRHEVNESFPPSLRGSFSLPEGPTSHVPVAGEAARTPKQTQGFVDPAILSFGRAQPRPVPASKPQPPSVQAPPVPRQMLVEVVRSSTTPITPNPPASYPRSTKESQSSRHGVLRTVSIATATLSEPFDDLSVDRSLEEELESEAAELGTDGGKAQPTRNAGQASGPMRQGGKRTRKARGKAGKNGHDVSPVIVLPQVEEADSSPVAVKTQIQTARRRSAKAQSPVAEADSLGIENGSLRKSRQRPKQSSRRERAKALEAQSGWATEDATDIQELGDFDFEGNLSKFDKREIFKQMKREDTIADDARLVSHNRLPRTGTAGGKNLHWTENVLEVPHIVSNGVAKWNSEAGESEEDISEAKVSSGRGSQRAPSRASIFRAPSRKGSSKGQELLNSVEVLLSSKTKASLSTSPYLGSVPVSRPSLRIQGSNKLCPCLSPLQMLEFEQYAITELGLSEDMLAENAARAIAQIAIRSLRERATGKHASILKLPLIVTAGNHRSGARALAAARHLHCHGFKISATLMGSEHEEDLLDSVRQQLNAFRKSGGAVVKPSALLDTLKNGALVPALLIDSLLGIHTSFDDLRGDDQAWYFELAILVNRNEWKVLSVDVPSGLDASTGEITHADSAPSQPLAFFPSAIVSLGAPKSWLLNMLRERDEPLGSVEGDPALYVADIGISNVVWKRLGNRRSRGIEFGGEWVLGLRYQAGAV